MSHVSTTAHYHLPIYGGSDIINPLTDVNGTNEALDTAIYEVAQELASSVTDIADVKNKVGDASLDTASQNLSGAVNELKSAIDTQGGDITDIEANVGTLQSQMATTTGNITTLNTTVAGLQTEMSGKASQTALQTLNTTVAGLQTEMGGKASQTDLQTLTSEVDKLKPTRTPDITITADGVKNLGQIFTEIADAINLTKLTPFSVIDMRVSGSNYASCCNLSALSSPDGVRCSYCNNLIDGSTPVVEIYTFIAKKSTSGASSRVIVAQIKNNTTLTADQSSVVPTAGSKFRIYY